MAEWSEILEAVAAALGADRDGGRERLLACWASTTDRDAAQRCVLAHYLADLEPGLTEEVAWDERALESFAAVGDGDLAAIGIPRAAAMEPSLRLNLADDYRRQGRVEEARRHLEAGLARAHLLPDDGYGATIRQGLYRLQRQLDGEENGG